MVTKKTTTHGRHSSGLKRPQVTNVNTWRGTAQTDPHTNHMPECVSTANKRCSCKKQNCFAQFMPEDAYKIRKSYYYGKTDLQHRIAIRSYQEVTWSEQEQSFHYQLLDCNCCKHATLSSLCTYQEIFGRQSNLEWIRVLKKINISTAMLPESVISLICKPSLFTSWTIKL